MTWGAIGSDETPLYVRLKQTLRNDIRSQMSHGDLVPSEAELIARYGVSRTTVRLALGALANEGLVVKRQGRGTFVANPKQTVLDAGGLFVMSDVGLDASLISSERITPDERITALLELPHDASVLRIRWLQLQQGSSQCYRVSYLTSVSGIDLPDHIDSLEQVSAAVEAVRAAPRVERECVEIVLADQFRASQLRVSQGAPLLLVESVISNAGVAVELTRGFYSGHSARLRMRAPALLND